ncbi:MAG: DUF5703 domain-containing protein [bacterium]
MKRSLPPIVCLFLHAVGVLSAQSLSTNSFVPAEAMRRYNVIWNSPSKNAAGIMPIGNGDVAAGVYAIENGDLYLLLAKNDAYTYQGDLFKTGRVKISLDPNPLQSGKPFQQTLDLATGSILINADQVKIRIWSDANRPVTHVEINSPTPLSVTARPEFWKRFDGCVYNETGGATNAPAATPPQDVLLKHDHRLLWYFAVGDQSVYPNDLDYYGVKGAAHLPTDPFRNNTFGNLLESPQMKLQGEELRGQGTAFDMRIHSFTKQTAEASDWIKSIEKQADKPLNTEQNWKEHCAWWSEFWNRSWIIASDRDVPSELREKLSGEADSAGKRTDADDAALVAQSYNVFRFLMACQSRGSVPVKFNGGLFTQQLIIPEGERHRRSGEMKKVDGGMMTHEDDRLWGRRFTFQNQRLLYWPLLASGDYDLMKPFFEYYAHLLPIRKAITKAWFGHDGAYYRENIEPDGAERDCGKDGRPARRNPGEAAHFYHDYYFTCGLETTMMMMEYVRDTGDEKFRDEVFVPFAREILKFYNRHYACDDKGKLRMDPAQSLETWWLAVNPSPDIAGLRSILEGLIKMKAGTSHDQESWKKLLASVPEIPKQQIQGKTAIAPAEKWENKHNDENGELYPVFPFTQFGKLSGSEDLVNWTMTNRTVKDANESGCWSQDQIDWALAGNAAEAAAGLVRRFRTASSMCRFPLYGKETPDSCPDFDHFGSGSVALQRMLVQEDEGKILLLPAWPSNWDVDFRLHLHHGGVISGKVKEGQLENWEIKPASLKKKVVVCTPQTTPSSPAK